MSLYSNNEDVQLEVVSMCDAVINIDNNDTRKEEILEDKIEDNEAPILDPDAEYVRNVKILL